MKLLISFLSLSLLIGGLSGCENKPETVTEDTTEASTVEETVSYGRFDNFRGSNTLKIMGAMCMDMKI